MSIRVESITPAGWRWVGCELQRVYGSVTLSYNAPFIESGPERAYVHGDVFQIIVDGKTSGIGLTPSSGRVTFWELRPGEYTAELVIFNSSGGGNLGGASVRFRIPDSPQPPPPRTSKIVLKTQTWPGLKFVRGYQFFVLIWPGGSYKYSSQVDFTVPESLFGKRARLLGVDLSAAGDATQRTIGRCSGIRGVDEAYVTTTTITGSIRVSPEFPLTHDGLEGVVLGGSLYEKPVPWGWLYLATRPAARVS